VGIRFLFGELTISEYWQF